MSDADLLARVQEIEDRLELAELPARYARGLDDRNWPALRELFCTDAVFEHEGGSTRVAGRDAIERFYRETLAETALTLHIPHAQVVERLDGDEASGWVVSHAEMAAKDGYAVVANRYADTYRREDGRWRFARRSVGFWYFTTLDELAVALTTPERWTYPGPPRAAGLPETLKTYRRFAGTG